MPVRFQFTRKNPMKIHATAILLTAVITMSAIPALAQAGDERWTYSLQPYVWLPGVKANLNYGPPPVGGNSPNVSMDAEKLLNAIDMAAMLSGEARKGRWLIGVDAMYLDFGHMDSRVTSVDFNPGSGPVNIATANLNAGGLTDLSGTLLTLTGGYAAMKDARNSIDVIAGLRYFRMHARTNWQLSAVVAGPGGSAAFTRTGVADKSDDLWTGVIGVKGRMMLGASDWFVNYYLDVGSGSSARTWQGIGGVGYAFKWGDVLLDYRALHYNVGGQNLIDELTASGLSIGARFRF